MSWKTYLLVAAIMTCGGAGAAASARLAVHTFAEVDSLQKQQKRNVLVFIGTDWCSYCLAMERTTFRNGRVVELLNDKFWFVRLNAEDKRDIVFAGRTFRYRPTGANTGIHELAEHLGSVDGRVSYPTVCLLNADGERLFRYGSYLSADEMLKLLQANLPG